MAQRTRTPPADATPGSAPAVPDPSAVTYHRKYTRCNKPTCRICAEGPGHGPYWYTYWWENGKTKSRYIGKHAPPDAGAPDPQPAAVPAFRVTTLGGFSVTRSGVALADSTWSRRKAVSLFKLLLSVPGRRQTREQLLDLLWPDEDPVAASAALRGATHGARRALDLPSGNSILEARAGVLALADNGTLWVDADAFAASANAALAGHDIAACRAALALYGGAYLPDDLYEDWTTQRREELAALRIAVLLHLARLCGEGGDLAEARAALATLLAADPANEDAAIRQMTILAATGDRGEALRVFERLRSTLDEQLGLEPNAEAAGLAMRLRKHRRAPPARPLAAPTPPRLSNLPTALSTFVGREGERETIRRALGTARLVTLTGPGGAGKTRLALRVGESLLEAYPDGVWLCELAGLAPIRQDLDAQSGPNPVTRTLAGALGLLEDPQCPLERTIGTFLEARHLLLVLDNCEHMLDPVARLVASLLEKCERLTVLATSREALGLPGELVCEVPALSLPSAGQRFTAASLDTYDAILLFVERARARRPGFVLDDATTPLVLDICRRLDGIPLAIELAAARLAFLSLEDLAARLDNRFSLLVGGSRVALPRQQTLRAAMDWSYSLLGEKERTLLRRLTVFVGGWTPVAAEGVCADADLPAELVLETLGALVAKSLVTFTEDEFARYGMLETVRQYGQLKLTEGGEQAPHARRLTWLAEHCESMMAAWSAADQGMLLRRLDHELENIRAALAWGLGRDGDRVGALHLANALGRYWYIRGLAGEGRRWTTRALDAAPQAPAALRASALNRCAILARTEGDLKGAGRAWEASLTLFRELDDEAGIARVIGNLGLLRYDLGDDTAAEKALAESIKIHRGQGNRQSMADSLLNLGLVHTRQRRFAEAESALAQAADIWQDLGDQAGLCNAHLHTAHLARDQEQLERAAGLYAASLRISLALDDRPRQPPALEGIAHVLLRWSAASGRERLVHELSTHLFACAAALRDSTGVPLPTVSQLVYQPDLLRLQTSLGTERFEAAWSAGWEMPALPLIERLLVPQGAGEPSLSMHAESDVMNLTPLLLLGPELNN